MSVRLAYAAAHIVMRESYAELPHSLDAPGDPAEIAEHIDWDATTAWRRRLDGLGFAIAEAMDTAQRFHIGWRSAERLIRECGALGLANGFVAGAGVDHLPRIDGRHDLIDGVVEQAGVIRDAGGEVILLPLPWLAQQRCGEDDYVEVYGEIVRRLDGPLYVHWLGEMFHPGLKGYFPGDSFRKIMALDPAKVRGAKLSLLDAELEVELRRELLLRDQILLTGDDFNFARLIMGDDPAVVRHTTIGVRQVALGDFSHALLGILDGIALPASRALALLAEGYPKRYLALIKPAEELSRWIFQEPTQHYKAGLAFLAWLNGHQGNFLLANREEKARSREHYLRVVELAKRAGALDDPAAARARLDAIDWERSS